MTRKWLGLWAACCFLGCGSGPRSQPELVTPDGRASGAGSEAASSEGTRGSDLPRDGGASGAAPSGDAGAIADPSAAPQTLAQRVCGSALARPQRFPASPRAEKVRDGFGFLEGPVWLASGVLLFSDMDFAATGAEGPPARIHRFRPPAGFDVFAEGTGSNGLALDPDGAVLACTHDLQTVSRFDPKSGRRTSLSLTFMGKHFNSPNDLVARADGTIYFTDPDWQLGPRSSETGKTGVYRVSPAGAVSLVSDRLDRPNGIALSLDERTLYVGSAGDDIVAFPLDATGAPGEPTVFASPGGSDGMTVDCAGNLYVTGDRVRVYSPAGELLATITLDGEPSNLAFGGDARTTLYITAGPALFAITLGEPGLPY